MQGHPWIYKDSISVPQGVYQAQLCQVIEPKGEIGWAIYDPHCPLALRMLNSEKSPPTHAYFAKLFERAFHLRQSVRSPETNAYRLFNGEGDLLPGLVCDIYDQVAVVQFDGRGPREFWDHTFIADWLLKNTPCQTVIEKKRRIADECTTELMGGANCENEIVIREHGAHFFVNLDRGQKTGFFLDQRDNRHYVRSSSRDLRVLNLFSYSGGFSINAGLGGARKVASLDISKGAIDLAIRNCELNKIPRDRHEGLCVDVFEYLNNEKEMWDHIIVDPPSMSHSENQKSVAKAKYTEIFTAAAKRVAKRGQLSLSSCSSHVSFNDFFEIIQDALSAARKKGQILRVSGQGSDHPFPHACPELRYLKFVHLVLE